MKEIGTLLSEFRQENKLTQEAFAARIGCTKQAVSNYERGTRIPSYEVLETIADEFNVDISLFISKEERKARLGKIYRTYNVAESDLPAEPDDELWELREAMRRNPDVRVLFDLSKNASPQAIKRTVAVLKALKDDDEG